MDYTAIVAVVLGAIVLYLLWDTYANGNIEPVSVVQPATGKVEKYWVQNKPDKEDAAKLLAGIQSNLLKLHTHLIKMYPDDVRVQQLQKNFRAENVMEGEDSDKYTSYSVNKGEKIVFCLRRKDETNSLMDLNTMMFVAIHEYGHVATSSTGHTQEFWDNFSWLLLEAMNIGIYTKQDFKNQPEPYCGIEITSSPLDNK